MQNGGGRSPRRGVEYDADNNDGNTVLSSDEVLDSYDGSHNFANHLPIMRSADSLHMTMTPTTQFLEKPILLDMAKDGVSTGSSTTLPGRRDDDDRRDGDGIGLRGIHGAIVHEELLKLEYRSPNLIWVAVAGSVGLALGIILSDLDLHTDTQWWIGICGYMYFRVLQCISLPLIFTSVTLCVAQLVLSSKGKSIMVRLAIMFIVAAFLSAAIGLLAGYAMSPTYARQTAPPVKLPRATIAVECPNELYLTSKAGACVGEHVKDATQWTLTNVTGFTIASLFDTYDIVDQDVTYATQISDFFSTAFQENIAEAFAASQYLGIIVFAMFIGAGVVVTHDAPDMTGQTNYLFQVLKQLDVVLELILNWLIRWTPAGTMDAMTFTIMTGTIKIAGFHQAMYLPITLLIALTVNFFLVVCVGYYAFVRKNPFTFFWYLMPALIYMLASQTYMATIPIMMRSVGHSKQVSRTLSHFTISLGTALSMCGHACFFTIACMFMAYTSGLESKLTPGRVILLVVVSTLSSFGVPDDTNASLTYVATIWRTVFGSAPPNSFTFVIAMEWLTVRMRRIYNITVVAFIARVIAEQLDETAEDEEDRAMAAHDSERDMGPISPL